MSANKISIIVPVYKVEKYLRDCVDSILSQTYRNLEIILVDDGSPDHCGEICDEYAKRDDRITVIHKPNGGLSDARNAGLDICTGDWISFIDSDDYVSPFFLQILLNTAINDDSEIATLSRGVDFWDNKSYRPALAENADDFTSETLDAQKALELMLYQKIATGAQWKLCKRYLWKDLRFPVGYYYEDVATTYKTFLKAKTITIIHGSLYAYRKRSQSIIRQPFSEKKLSALKISDELITNAVIEEWGLRNAAVSRAFAMIYSVFLQIPENQPETQKLVWENILQYRCFILRNCNPLIRRKNKIAAIISYLGMSASYTIGRKFGQKGTFN